jgi:2-amino-4-hydroxy-6-hydroxymethyldihydropteridine diphosphokinase
VAQSLRAIEDEPGLPSWAQVKRKRVKHIRRVAKLLERWADELDVSAHERSRWLRAAYYHDAIKDAPTEELRALADIQWGPRNLLHGPAAAVLAEREGEKDEGVLAAVRYHSVGWVDWDQPGRMLYLADYLEPGRSRQPKRVTIWRELVAAAPDVVLTEIARRRVLDQISQGHPILPETAAFWNSLVWEG